MRIATLFSMKTMRRLLRYHCPYDERYWVSPSWGQQMGNKELPGWVLSRWNDCRWAPSTSLSEYKGG
jgi:hypothetical protein